MPPLRPPKTSDPFQYFNKYLDSLEREIRRLENQRAPTVPFYDANHWPAESIEGQIVIAEPIPIVPSFIADIHGNKPVGGSTSYWDFTIINNTSANTVTMYYAGTVPRIQFNMNTNVHVVWEIFTLTASSVFINATPGDAITFTPPFARTYSTLGIHEFDIAIDSVGDSVFVYMNGTGFEGIEIDTTSRITIYDA